MRIDKINSTQKKTQETPTQHRRAFEAEEKLKKLAEQADLAKKLIIATPKDSNTSKSAHGKSEETKKSSTTSSVTSKKTLQLVLQKVKKVQKKGLLNAQKGKLLIVGKKQSNSTKILNVVVGTKVGFQRHLKKNQSQRIPPSTSRLVDVKSKKINSGKTTSKNQNISKGEVTKTSKKTLEVGVGTTRSRSANISTRNTISQNGK